MFGCEGYPGGYEFLEGHPGSECKDSEAFGGIAVLVLLLIAIIGAYILPTVLIGIVSIKFDDSSKLFEVYSEEKKAMKEHLKIANEYLPDFFTHERIQAVVKVFRRLNSGGQITLDQAEISPFFHYSVDLLFQVELQPLQCQSLFYLLDTSKTTEIGLGEFITFVSILKKMHNDSKVDPDYVSRFFGADAKLSSKNREKSIWDSAMDRVHKEAFDTVWDSVLRSINGVIGNTLEDKVKYLFSHFDSDGTGNIDAEELGQGLKSCGVLLNDTQLVFFFKSIDTNNSGDITIADFVDQIKRVKKEKEKETEKETEEELGRLQLRQLKKKGGSFSNNVSSTLSTPSSTASSSDLMHKGRVPSYTNDDDIPPPPPICPTSPQLIKLSKLERENEVLKQRVDELEKFKASVEKERKKKQASISEDHGGVFSSGVESMSSALQSSGSFFSIERPMGTAL
jgi:Ca2+-binding EF-hand superfamily protein